MPEQTATPIPSQPNAPQGCAVQQGTHVPMGTIVHPDDMAVDALAAAMKAKLAKQRAKGYGGWDTDCTQERLSDLLRGHVDKGDPIDVANFCAFLLARGEGIAAVQQGVPEGFVLMPKRVTADMQQVMDTDGWLWEDLLAAACAITEKEYTELSTHPTQQGLAQDAARQAARAKFEEWAEGRFFSIKRDAAGKSYRQHVTNHLWQSFQFGAALSATQQGLDANMFWDADDPETCQTSVNNVVVEVDSYRGLMVGDTVTIQRAVKLPDLEVRITMVPDREGNGDLEWEELAAQAKQGVS